MKTFIAVAWLLIIGLSYYRIFPVEGLLPSFPHGVPGLPHGITAFLCLSLIIIAANGWGKYFWDARELSGAERLVFATGSGLGLFSIVILAGDLFSFINPLLYVSLLLSGFILFMLSAKRMKGGCTLPLMLLLTVATLPLVSAMIGALAPPTQFDSLAYHLALPAHYIRDGRMSCPAHNIFFSFPQNGEMLYQMALVLDGDILANLIGWSYLLMSGIAVFAFARRYFGSPTALVAGILWYCTPTIMFLATGTYIDLLLAFYIILSMQACMLWFERRHGSWLIAAGAFAGLALGTKYTAAASVFAICVLIAVHDPRRSVKHILTFISAAFIVFLPWLVKNAVYLKNPVAPWGSELFSSSIITTGMARGYFSHIRGHGLGLSSIKDIIDLPWNLTVSGVRYGGGFDVIGPAFLLFLPLLLLRREIGKISKNLILFCICFGVVWLFTGKVLRFLVPVMPFLCILSAAGLGAFASTRWRALTGYLILLSVMLHNMLFFHWVMSFVDPYSTVFFGEERNSYLARKLTPARAINECINTLPQTSMVLFLGETRGYYCNVPSIVPTVFDVNPLFVWANSAENPRALLDRLRREHITHVLENRTEYDRLGLQRNFTERGLQNWRGLKRSGASIVFSDTHCLVYAINN